MHEIDGAGRTRRAGAALEISITLTLTVRVAMDLIRESRIRKHHMYILIHVAGT
jgi:hypothetical protein